MSSGRASGALSRTRTPLEPGPEPEPEPETEPNHRCSPLNPGGALARARPPGPHVGTTA